MTISETGIFENYPPATFRADRGSQIAFVLEGEVRRKKSNRLVPHRRPYRPGAKLDSTGREAYEFTFTAYFNNTVIEPGVDNARAPYPFMLRALEDEVDNQATGTLVLPQYGAIRGKWQTSERIERTDERDVGRLVCTFIEDNEDRASSQSFRAPSVRATVVAQAEQARFSGNGAGAIDSDLVSLGEFAAQIEELLLAPGREVSDLQSKVNASLRSIRRVVDAQEQLAADVGLEHDEPRGSEFWRQLVRMADLQAQAASEKFASRPRVKAFVIDVERTSLFEIAARLQQDAAELLDLNSERLPDPLFLERGDVIRVFETAPA